MELLLIRHGLPVRIENDDGRPADPPLSEVGRGQAEQLARWLRTERIDRVYASPLLRARETARPLAKSVGAEIEIEPGVVEFDLDSQIYIPMEELKATDYERWRELVAGGFWDTLDLAGFARTVVLSLERIIEENAGSRVAVVCHGGVINFWTAHVLGMRQERLFFDPTYTSINRFLAAGSGERSLVSLNEAAHLRSHPEREA